MLWHRHLCFGEERGASTVICPQIQCHSLILYMEKTKYQFYNEGFCYLQSNWTKGRTEVWHFSVTPSSTWLKDIYHLIVFAPTLQLHIIMASKEQICTLNKASYAWVRGSDAHFPYRDVDALLCFTETTLSSDQCFTPDIIQWLNPAWARCKISEWLSSSLCSTSLNDSPQQPWQFSTLSTLWLQSELHNRWF